MTGRCDHCDALAALHDVGDGLNYCAACRDAEAALKAPPPPAPVGRKWVNQHGRTAKAHNSYPGERARTGPLDAGQKAHLCILAREAFEVVMGRAPVDGHELSRWRHDEQRKACGFGSLTDCLQDHVKDLEAHFLTLKGETGRAFERQMRAEVGNPAVARAILRQNLAQYGLQESYAATICRARCKCELAQASVKQLWNVIFTIRKNQQRKARKGANA